MNFWLVTLTPQTHVSEQISILIIIFVRLTFDSFFSLNWPWWVPLDLDRLPDRVWAEIRVFSHLHVAALLAHDHLVLDGYMAVISSSSFEIREVNGAQASIQGVLLRHFWFTLFHLEWLLQHPNCHLVWLDLASFACWVSFFLWHRDFLVHYDLGHFHTEKFLLIPLYRT